MKTYRELEEELHSILERIEESSYDELEDLLEDYDTGVKLVSELQKKLDNAKNKIKKARK